MATGLELEHGFSGDLTVGDRARLRAIILKHHRFYFAEGPSAAQMDNLIDGLGLRVAERLVREAVDGGKFG